MLGVVSEVGVVVDAAAGVAGSAPSGSVVAFRGWSPAAVGTGCGAAGVWSSIWRSSCLSIRLSMVISSTLPSVVMICEREKTDDNLSYHPPLPSQS